LLKRRVIESQLPFRQAKPLHLHIIWAECAWRNASFALQERISEQAKIMFSTPAIICAARAHGEHGVIVRALTEAHGLVSGYVSGGRSRMMRPVLVPGNSVAGEWRERGGERLASMTVEPLHSRAALLEEPLAATAIDWLTALTAATLPPEHPYPPLYQALEGVLGAIEAAPGARGWAATIVRYEALLLAELGFGLDLSSCAVTGGTDDLIWISPKSARAVSRAGAAGYEDRLLALPGFLLTGGTGDWPAVIDGLAITGHFLARSLLTERRSPVMAARERLVDRLARAAE
jgi:DNA repair protein RecO (recombination protein O)